MQKRTLHIDLKNQGQAAATTPLVQALLVVLLQAAVFLVAAEARLIAPLLPALATDLRTTIAGAGMLISAYVLPYGLFQLVYGPLADHFSRQRVVAVALGLFALGTLASGLMPDLGSLTLLRVLTGAAAAGVIPVSLAYLSDAVPYTERQALMGRLMSVALFGGVISAALGGLLADLLNWRALFIGYGALALIVAALLLWLPVRRVRPPGQPVAGFLAPYRLLAAQGGRRAALFYGLVAFEGFAAMGAFGYLGALLAERDRFSYAIIGVLLTLNGVGSMVVARLAGRLVRRLGESAMLRLGGTLMALGYLLTIVQPALVCFSLAMLLSGAGFSMAHSTLQTRATELAPAQRGTAFACFAFVLMVGSSLGTLVAGLVIERAGFSATMLASAALLALFAWLAGRLPT